MKRAFYALALAASLVPVAAVAADSDPRAAFTKIHDDAKASAYKSLSPAHASQVQAIVDQVNTGKLEPRDAATQIDGVLTDDEKTSVLAAQRQMREAMRAAMEAAGGPEAMGGPGGPGGPGAGPGGPGAGPGGPGAGPGGSGPPGAGGYGAGGGQAGQGRPAPDAGRALLGLSLTPEKMRELREKARGGQ